MDDIVKFCKTSVRPTDPYPSTIWMLTKAEQEDELEVGKEPGKDGRRLLEVHT